MEIVVNVFLLYKTVKQFENWTRNRMVKDHSIAGHKNVRKTDGSGFGMSGYSNGHCIFTALNSNSTPQESVCCSHSVCSEL
jgi:hypothetical protein